MIDRSTRRTSLVAGEATPDSSGSMTALVDQKLVAAALRGSREAFGGLVARHERSVYNVALRISNNREDASDITQNVFVKVCENLATYDPRFRFFSWLYRIAVNESLNLVDKRRPTSALDDTRACTQPGPDERYVRDRLRLTIQRAVLELPPHYREVIVLRHFAGLSYSELSDAVHVPENTVRSRLFTARRILRERLSAERS